MVRNQETSFHPENRKRTQPSFLNSLPNQKESGEREGGVPPAPNGLENKLFFFMAKDDNYSDADDHDHGGRDRTVADSLSQA